MKTNQIYTMLFLLSLYCCQNSKKANTTISETECIESVLARDNELGKARNHDCETMTLPNTIEKYTIGMRALNFEGCPEAFSVAFKDHISAWDHMGEFTKRYSELRGEMHILFDSIEKTKDSSTFKPLLKAIWDTWADVEITRKTNY